MVFEYVDQYYFECCDVDVVGDLDVVGWYWWMIVVFGQCLYFGFGDVQCFVIVEDYFVGGVYQVQFFGVDCRVGYFGYCYGFEGFFQFGKDVFVWISCL